MGKIHRIKTLALLMLMGSAGWAFAMEPNPDITPVLASTKPWTNAGEVSVLSTNGNSKATTTSVKDTFHYHWTKSLLELVGDALGSSSRETVTAEQYDASEKYTWLFSGENYVFERYAWDRNRFAGIGDRMNTTIGVGRYLLGTSSDTLLGEIGPGYTNIRYTDQPRNDYASGRAFADYTHVMSPTAKFTQNVEYVHDFNDSKNYILNTETALIASMTSNLSLKASYSWNRSGEPAIGFGKDDTITAVALVINY